MKSEFMLYIRNDGDGKAAMSDEEHLAFVRGCEDHIEKLKANRNLIAAQPIARSGVVVSKKGDGWVTKEVDPNDEIQVGYYHILAESIDDAVAIAKENPEFEFVESASIEVRPVKMKEEQTSFVYPIGTNQEPKG